ncbi:MAG TPA: tyrosinase family protein [Pyrinomonadaceae bacterium]|nr:tyrosinase family protein [Pyrinomonadaceae bacterium]
MEDFGLFSRRDFMKGAGALGITGLALWSGACESACKKIKERPTRRNIANLAANDPIIQTYKDAVAAMKALPATDGRNWNKQADIHNNKCPHQNWWFLPWHRAYLANFESICRKLTGNADFALPYWNWSTSPSIPAPFWGAGNPLFNSTRTATQTSVANSLMVGPAKVTEILDQTNFFLFASGQSTTQRQRTTYGILEGTPHNYIHNFVGGDMLSFTSPKDPVFWCHHNMVECLWVDWNINRGNANTNDQAWYNLEFTDDFVDGDGNPAPIKVAVTMLFPLLTYQFEPCSPGMAEAAVSKDRATLEKFLREGAPSKLEFIKRYELRRPLTTDLRPDAPTRLKVEPEAFRTVLDVSGREKAVLTIDEVEPPAKQDVFVRVFINKPDANASTPIDDPHYAGSFAFFCCEDEAMKGHNMPASTPVPGAAGPAPASHLPKLTYLVDATPTIRKLSQGGSLSPDLDLTLVTVPIEANRPVETQRINVGRLELAVARF